MSYELPVLLESDAIELLNVLCPEVVHEFPAATRDLVRKLECLPLALQVAGRLLAFEYASSLNVELLLSDLQTGESLLEEQAPIDTFDVAIGEVPTVGTLLRRSTDALPDDARELFMQLGSYAPRPAVLSADQILNFGHLPDPWGAMRTLLQRGLLESEGNGTFSVHALLVVQARFLANHERPNEPVRL